VKTTELLAAADRLGDDSGIRLREFVDRMLSADKPSELELELVEQVVRSFAHFETQLALAKKSLDCVTTPIEIPDCLGRKRRATRYPGGDWNCPFCNAASRAGVGCENPACFARISPSRCRIRSCQIPDSVSDTWNRTI
jgi:hypothetical protein